jgi:alpha-tubulin suppressor-like RCC1 family protein
MRSTSRFMILSALICSLMGLYAVPAEAKAISRSISIAASTPAPVAGTTFTLSGTLTKTPKGASVQVQRKSGSKWVKAYTVKTTTSSGTWSRSITISTVGTSYYRAYAAKKGTRKAATSKSLTIRTGGTITTAALKDGTVKVSYAQQLALSPKTTGTWTAAGLPSGLAVSAAGAVTGTPTTAGTGQVTATFTPKTGGRATSRTLPLTIVAPAPPAGPTVTTTALPDGTTGTTYDGRLVGSQTGTWSVISGSLPAGLTLSPSGAITGTATTPGDTTFTVQLTTANGQATRALSIHVDLAPVTPAVGPDLIDAGGLHTCRVKPDHTLWCWGSNAKGQLGIGQVSVQKPYEESPQRVGTGADWSTVSASTGDVFGFTCATKTDLSLWCWGSDMDLQLGNGAPTADVDRPAQIGLGKHWSSVAAGTQQACAITTSGELWCWGSIGAGTAAGAVPSRVGSASDWTDVSTGGSHTCGLRQGGSLWCWGFNYRGQLGLGAGAATSVDTPTRVGTAAWTSISAGNAQTCGITANAVRCWGINDGRLGVGATVADAPSPVTVVFPAGAPAAWTDVSTGGNGNFGHTCATGTGGTAGVYCWGRNSSGQLGDGTQTDRTSPVPVAGTTGTWTPLSVGGDHSCVGRVGLSPACWGSNSQGQLGLGNLVSRNQPQTVS